MRRAQYSQWTLVAAFVCLALVAGAATAAPRQVATLSGGAAGVEFRPVIEYEKLVLTVSGPGGMSFRHEFTQGQAATFSAFGKGGQTLPNGDYTYELLAVPRFSPEVRQRLAAARTQGNERAVLAELRQAGLLPKGTVQSGGFVMENGTFIVAGGVEATGPKAAKEAVRAVTAADQVIPDDLIVQGSACVGLDCVNNENFGFDTIRLKENNLRIHFDDTSTQAGFPANDWRLIANDSASGGSSKFSIEDSTGAKTPFTITAGAATNSIFADSIGRIGLRTSTPVLDLHINTSNTPAIRLEQNNSGGFTAQTWDIGANEANFFVRDVTGGSRLSFRIRPGAPTSSIDISADGDVGIGTASPEVKLHVFGGNTDDTNMSLGPNPIGIPATESALNIGYGGASFGRASGFFNVRNDTGATAPNPSLRFMTADLQRIMIDNQGNIAFGADVSGANPAVPLIHIGDNARLEAGIWTNGSSRAIKHDIQPLEASEALAAFTQLQPVRYRGNESPDEVVLGFIAEDVPELVAYNDRKSLSPMDMVAVLTKVVQEQQKTIDQLTERLGALEEKEK
jgi:hypothetical protein